MTLSDQKIFDAISAIRSGNRDLGRTLLTQEVSDNPQSELAWLWLSACYDLPEHKRHCLNKALEINPTNQFTIQALSKIIHQNSQQPNLGDIFAPSQPLTYPQQPYPTITQQYPYQQQGNSNPIPQYPFPQPNLSYQYPQTYTNQPQSYSPIEHPGLNTTAKMTIILLVVLGLFWIGIGLLQFGLAFSENSDPQTTLLLLGMWNIFIAIANLMLIKDVMKRYKNVVKNLGILSIFGSVWGLIQLASGSWGQICAIPLYVMLGILVYVNKNYYIYLTPKESKKFADQGHL
jgi:hypothetical protein